MSNSENIKIISDRFGEMDIPVAEIINFPDGVLGFESIKRYALFPVEEGSPLLWLQAIDSPELAFVVVDPVLIKADYRVEVKPVVLEPIELEKLEDAHVYVILKVPTDPTKMTANLKGPLILNQQKKLAMQLALNDPELSTQHKIVQQEEKSEQGKES